jgi:hypothetical protein
MNPIVQAPDGTYVDLSKIVAVSNIWQETSSTCYGRDTSIKLGFNINFIPTGIPFKQGNNVEFFIKIISKDYWLSNKHTFDSKYNFNYNNPKIIDFFSDEEETKFNNRKEEARKDWDSKREELVILWKLYKDAEIKA